MSIVASDPPRRFLVLDSLRGVCACMVALYHLEGNGAISHIGVVRNGFLFVDFFFVLSGFVIAASYGERLAGGFSIPRFMLLRLGRIYPLHLVMLMVFLTFELAFLFAPAGLAGRQPFGQSYEPSSFAACLLLIQPFVGPEQVPWNGPSWSIAVEVWTYLIFACAFRWLDRWIMPICALLAALAAYYLYGLTDRYLNVFHDGALARCLFGFSLGVLGYRLFMHRRWQLPFAFGSALEIGALAVAIGLLTIAGPTPLSLAVPPLFFLIVPIFAHEAGVVSRLLVRRPFLLVGMLSYSIYMVHLFLEYRLVNLLQIVQKLGHGRWTLIDTADGHNHLGGDPLFDDVVSIAMLALIVGCAWMTYRYVEKPAQAWSRRRLLGARPRPAAAASEAEAPTF